MHDKEGLSEQQPLLTKSLLTPRCSMVGGGKQSRETVILAQLRCIFFSLKMCPYECVCAHTYVCEHERLLCARHGGLRLLFQHLAG